MMDKDSKAILTILEVLTYAESEMRRLENPPIYAANSIARAAEELRMLVDFAGEADIEVFEPPNIFKKRKKKS